MLSAGPVTDHPHQRPRLQMAPVVVGGPPIRATRSTSRVSYSSRTTRIKNRPHWRGLFLLWACKAVKACLRGHEDLTIALEHTASIFECVVGELIDELARRFLDDNDSSSACV